MRYAALCAAILVAGFSGASAIAAQCDPGGAGGGIAPARAGLVAWSIWRWRPSVGSPSRMTCPCVFVRGLHETAAPPTLADLFEVLVPR